MTYVLDTNAVSALMKADAHVVMRLTQTTPETVFVPQPVIAEIEIEDWTRGQPNST